ncbi:MAG: exodeoxyribonuclease VII large subunit, partial [Nostoc sp.]
REAVHDSWETAENKLQVLRNRLRRLRLDRQVQLEVEKLAWKRQQLVQITTGRSQQATQHLELLRQKLASLDPKAVLQRGYAVVRGEDGAIARSAAELEIGQDLFIQLGQGGVKVKVIEINELLQAQRTHRG